MSPPPCQLTRRPMQAFLYDMVFPQRPRTHTHTHTAWPVPSSFLSIGCQITTDRCVATVSPHFRLKDFSPDEARAKSKWSQSKKEPRFDYVPMGLSHPTPTPQPLELVPTLCPFSDPTQCLVDGCNKQG